MLEGESSSTRWTPAPQGRGVSPIGKSIFLTTFFPRILFLGQRFRLSMISGGNEADWYELAQLPVSESQPLAPIPEDLSNSAGRTAKEMKTSLPTLP